MKLLFSFRRLFIFCSCTLLFSGCSGRDKVVVQIPEPLEPAVVEPLEPLSPGSLWTGDEGNWWADIKAHRVGDIVTVTIQENSSASKQASTQTDRDTAMSASIPHLLGLENSEFFNEKNLGIDLSNLVEANFSNQFSGNGTTSRKEDLDATLTAQVIKVYPNGNMKIRGGKSIIVNNENQIIYLTGIVRQADVTADNTIDSGSILNAQIAYTGKGAISDKQEPGWLMRVLDNTWPF